jgi:hypothetical protein
MDDLRWTMLLAFAAGSLFWIARHGANVVDAFVLIAPVYALARGIIGYVPGYTGFAIAKWFILAALIMAIGRVGKDHVNKLYWILIASALVQLLVWLFPTPWKIPNNGLITEYGYWLYGFGSYRHRIRFATAMLTGLIPAFWMIRRIPRNPLSDVQHRVAIGFLGIAITGFSIALFFAWSNTIIACYFVAVLMLFLRPKARKEAKHIEYYFFGVAVVVWLLMFKPGGFTIDIPRLNLWQGTLSMIRETIPVAIFGRGPGAFGLIVGSCHPHCSLLEIAYNLGAIGGMLSVFVTSLMLCVFGFGNRLALIGFVLVAGSTLTNSLFAYPEMVFFVGIYGGLCAREGYEIINTESGELKI